MAVPLIVSVPRAAGGAPLIIDDFKRDDLVAALGTSWRGVSDQVMGGISEAGLQRALVDGRPALRLTGDVRLEHNGGFIQASLNLAKEGEVFDASGYAGIRLAVRGNDEIYGVHLRTGDVRRPWQSYRSRFMAPSRWTTIDLPFTGFATHRLDAPFEPSRLRRIGLAAIGRAFYADLAVSNIQLYR